VICESDDGMECNSLYNIIQIIFSWRREGIVAA